MKKILIAFMLVGLITSCGSLKSFDAPPAKEKIVVLTSNKNVNFIKANEWMVETFKNAESVIQFADKEAGIVKGKYLAYIGIGSFDNQHITITVRVKDGASKIELDGSSATFSTYLKSNGEDAPGLIDGFTPKLFDILSETLMLEFENYMIQDSKNKF